MEITESGLYETIGRLVIYKEALERQVETLKKNLAEQLQEGVRLRKELEDLKNSETVQDIS